MLALKRKDILASATTGVNPEDIVQSEMSQSQKNTHCWIPLVGGT